MIALLENPIWIGFIVIFCAWRADVNYHEGSPMIGGLFAILALLNLFNFVTRIFAS